MPLDRNTRLNSLGLPKPPGETRVVVAMSGGVDSSVVAAELARAGYDVVGITLQLYDHGAALAKKGACCAGRDIHDARRVAEQLGFPHYVLDYESVFRDSVIEDFADNYLTVYAGVDELKVEKGDRVRRGQQIAVVRAGDPSFLHFEIRQGLESIDPVPLLN